MLHENSISYLTFEESGDNRTLYDGVLELEGGGAWTYKSVGADSRLPKQFLHNRKQPDRLLVIT